MWRKRGKNKYGAKKVEHAGLAFDSQLERALFDQLSLRQIAGEIQSLTHHPATVYLTEARVIYKPDFAFINAISGEKEWAEAKGFPTPSWAIKKRLWKTYGPGRLHIYGGSASRLTLLEVLNPKGTK